MNRDEYIRRWQRERYHKMKVFGIKFLGGKCKECGSKKVLQFDHINPKTKKYGMSELWRKSIELIISELKKCQLLCRGCHTKKTLKECGKSLCVGRHGTISIYDYGCRCEKCTLAWRNYYRKYHRNLRD